MPGTYKWCFVPGCTSTTYNTPGKIFVTVPSSRKTDKMKRLWFNAARRDFPKSKSLFFCCEDHFDLPYDFENLEYVKMFGGRLRVKKGVVPHIFDCHEDRRTASSLKGRESTLRRQHRKTVEEAVEEHNEDIPSEEVPDIDSLNHNVTPESDMTLCAPFTDQAFQLPTQQMSEKGTQTHIYRKSKHVQCDKNQNKSTATSPLKNKCDASTSTMESVAEPNSTHHSSSDSDVYDESHEEFNGRSCESSSEYECDGDSTKKMKLDMCRVFVDKDPKFYIGITKTMYWFLDFLENKSQVQKDHLILTLMKMKLNDPFKRLSDIFSMSEGYPNKIFKRTLPVLSHLLKTLIYMPSKTSIKNNLPIAFRHKFSHTQMIIDCLEIQIEKPSDPVFQSLTWSQYKKCNTLKYLLGATPDGFICYVSVGYGGRISDTQLFQDCGVLDLLLPNSAVMADRGFKHTEQMLANKACTLVRPPSVAASCKPTKEEVIKGKTIASVRIHVERVIGRMREYRYLLPHSTIDHNLVKYTDDVVTVACGLINIQSPIITK